MLRSLLFLPALAAVLAAGAVRAAELHLADLHQRGLAVSADGARFAVALDRDRYGSDAALVIVAPFDEPRNARALDLPAGFAWRDPDFSEDGERLLLATRCLDVAACGAGNEGWHLWEYDLREDALRRLTEPTAKYARWNPRYVRGSAVVRFVVADITGPVNYMQLIGHKLIAELDPEEGENILFPTPAKIGVFPDDSTVPARSRESRMSALTARSCTS